MMRQTGGPPRSREGYHWFRGWRRPTAAQRRVLDQLVAGGTNAQIAQRLGISEDGVKWHLSELRDEVGLAGRRELAEWWAEERRRPAVNLLFPFAALGRLATQNAVATVVVAGVFAASLAVGWFAFDALRGDDEADTAGVVPLRTPDPAAAVPVVPTPTPTPGPRGALLFDVETGESVVLPGEFTHRRWLDTEAMTFTALTGKPSVIDAQGNVRQISDSEGVRITPATDQGRVAIWDWDGGLLEVIDVESGEVILAGDFGSAHGSDRAWDVSPTSGKVAIGDRPSGTLTLYDLDASNPQPLFTTQPGETFWNVEWSPGGEWLLALVVTEESDGRIVRERSLVYDSGGRLILDDPRNSSWAGASALRLYQRSAGGRLEPANVLDVVHQGSIPVPEGALLCISPDGRYAVTGVEQSEGFNPPTDHRLVDLVTREVLAAATMGDFLINCDWTPDGRRVVLSSGGK